MPTMIVVAADLEISSGRLFVRVKVRSGVLQRLTRLIGNS
jgi:hypothetical protein